MVEPSSTPADDFQVPDKRKSIKHQDIEYNYKSTLEIGGRRVFMVYQDPLTSHKMAVKFEVMMGPKTGYRMNLLNNEDLILK